MDSMVAQDTDAVPRWLAQHVTGLKMNLPFRSKRRVWTSSEPTLLFWPPTWLSIPESVPGHPDVRILTQPADLPSADIVIFHIPTVREIPKHRRGQIWVAASMESDVNYRTLSNPEFMKKFDITMTYRRDSDVWTPYTWDGLSQRLRTPALEKDGDALAAYFVSNRRDRSGRSRYAHNLMRHIDVASFGRHQQNRQLPDDNGIDTKLATIARYKFTLAFENSITPDYVTEKFFHPLCVGSVPVYMGAPNVADFAPGENCYIDARDFSGPAELAGYLRHLDSHPAEYASYLSWKERPFRDTFQEMVEVARVHPTARLLSLIKHSKEF